MQSLTDQQLRDRARELTHENPEKWVAADWREYQSIIHQLNRRADLDVQDGEDY